ncbi:MAG TPA: hypothetical protein VGK02_06810 [Candidatus Aquicultor sp.]
MNPSDFLELAINGITFGMIYALIAPGYSIIYGVLKIINFAHSEIFAIGSLLGATFFTLFGVTDSTSLYLILIYVFLAFILSMLFTAIAGFVLEIIAYRPLRNAPRHRRVDFPAKPADAYLRHRPGTNFAGRQATLIRFRWFYIVRRWPLSAESVVSRVPCSAPCYSASRKYSASVYRLAY